MPRRLTEATFKKSTTLLRICWFDLLLKNCGAPEFTGTGDLLMGGIMRFAALLVNLLPHYCWLWLVSFLFEEKKTEFEGVSSFTSEVCINTRAAQFNRSNQVNSLAG